MSKRDSRAVWVWVRLCTHNGIASDSLGFGGDVVGEES